MDKRLYVELPPFTGRNVPITEIAKAIGKDAHYVRIGIQQGILKFGVAMKMGDSNEFSYYCSDRKVWEETGYFNASLYSPFGIEKLIDFSVCPAKKSNIVLLSP